MSFFPRLNPFFRFSLLAGSVLAVLSVIVVFWGKPLIENTPTDLQGMSSLASRLDFLKPSPEKTDVFVFGSSTVLGTALRRHGDADWRRNSFTSMLQEQLGNESRVSNLGFDGALPADMLALSRLTYELNATPDLVIIALNLRLFTQESNRPDKLMTRPWLNSVSINSSGHISTNWAWTPHSALRFFEAMAINWLPSNRYQESLQLALFGETPQAKIKSVVDYKLNRSSGPNEMIVLLQQKAKYGSLDLSESHQQMVSIKKLIQFWKDRGVRAILFHSQDNPKALENLVDEAKYKIHLSSLQSFVSSAGAEFVSTKDLSSAEDFIDTTHLNRHGNLLLAERITQHIKTKPLEKNVSVEHAPGTAPSFANSSKGFEIGSLMFWLCLFLLFAATQWSRTSQMKHGIYLMLSVLWLSSFAWTPLTGGLFVGFISLGFILPKLFTRTELSHRKLYFYLGLALVFLLFVFLNHYSWSQGVWDSIFPNNPLIRLVGISYMFFRIVHLLVDTYSGDLKEIRLLPYATFTMGFLTLVAGPITKYDDYVQPWQERQRPNPQVLNASLRIAWGLFKTTILAKVFFEMSQLNSGIESATSLQMITYLYSFAFYAFFDFSGYTDIVIGSGQLLGLRLPENFNWPFLSQSPSDIWKRWHMSFTEWLETYIFNPLMKQLTKITQRKHPLIVLTFCYFVAFFMAGLWHGTVSIIAWGLLTAGTIVLFKIIDHHLKQRIGKKKFKALKHNRYFILASHFATFNFICYSFSLIGLKADQLLPYHRKLFEVIF